MQHAEERLTELWKRSNPSPDGTHHIVNDEPLYEARFLRVMSFHEPGLAAVRGEPGAWHIDIQGAPAYSHIFLKTFGFYENLAAIQDKNGWLHITPDGVAAYAAVYDWCGNFQGGRAVVRFNDDYFHILPDGSAPYERRFAYAGDFREHRAVVRLANGLSTHIDKDGAFVHAHCYRDLGVYHKGFSCARDDGGWMHVNVDGIPIYDRRFAALEPFYNECAVASTFDGEIVTIDEQGHNVSVVTNKTQSSDRIASRNLFQELSGDMVGYWKTHALAAAVKLSVAEKLPLADGDVGAVLGLSEDNGRILLHALFELGAVSLRGDVWELTAKGEFLRLEHPHSLAGAALVWSEYAQAGVDRCLRALNNELMDDIFSQIAGNDDTVSAMHGMLAAYAEYDYSVLPELLPLGNVRRLIDAGGGTGVLSRMISQTHKDVEIILLDRPEVLSASNFNADGKAKIVKHPCDIFSSWNIGADAVILARVLHDWNDSHALAILKNARAALPYGGKIFIVESVKKNAVADGLCSLHLLTMSGGRERIMDEYRHLMAAEKFQFLESRALRGDVWLLTGEAI